jgi:hypothetical protein
MTETLTGYSAFKTLVAQQVTRGAKTVYVVSIPINLVPEHLRIPDVVKPIDSNRAVSKSHAEEFGKYWLDHPDNWTVPPLLVDCSDSLEFQEEYTIMEGYRLGVLKLPTHSNKILRTLDGQHRIYGWNYIRTALFEDLETAKNRLMQSKQSGSNIDIQLAQEAVNTINESLTRMYREQVTLEIITGVTEDEHKTFFIDIADNALGINVTEKTRMDEVNMTSRVAKLLADQTPLFSGRIEMRKSSAAKSSKDLMSLANLRDVARHVCFGIVGKVSAKREAEFADINALEMSKHFIDAMLESANVLNQIADGSQLPKNLKDDSLLGSTTIWRCLAGAYHELAIDVDREILRWNSEGHKKFVSMATEAIKQMDIVEQNGERMLNPNWYGTECFNPGGLAPLSRAQDLKNLSTLFVRWSESGKIFEPRKNDK